MWRMPMQHDHQVAAALCASIAAYALFQRGQPTLRCPAHHQLPTPAMPPLLALLLQLLHAATSRHHPCQVCCPLQDLQDAAAVSNTCPGPQATQLTSPALLLLLLPWLCLTAWNPAGQLPAAAATPNTLPPTTLKSNWHVALSCGVIVPLSAVNMQSASTVLSLNQVVVIVPAVAPG
jgi:hypothetical protein